MVELRTPTPGGAQIGFIDLLYAVLAGVILQRLSLTLVFDNAARALALLLLLEDNLTYHQSSIIAGEQHRPYRPAAFLMDVAILTVWYLSYLAIDSRPAFFFVGVACFFAFKVAWEVVSYPEVRNGRLVYKTHLPLVVLALAVAALLPAPMALVVLGAAWIVFTPIWWTVKTV